VQRGGDGIAGSQLNLLCALWIEGRLVSAPFFMGVFFVTGRPVHEAFPDS
jgi:hypothetical protein